ncbi:serine hydrolase [Phenylobacterium sp.]|jgi:CubicO group peptidase (beta-lactamase class C family)|uniref:serine hydrolase n=1 Tax=Phenylobacterium sp. TaxID=1871053 RepID=UPI002F3E530F
MDVLRTASTMGRRLAGGTLACVLGLALASPGWAAPVAAPSLPPGAQPQDIDRLAARIQQTFSVPGMSVAIVKDGKVLFSKGYGVRALTKPDKADSETLFGIGSNTKAFTVAALSMLVDEGKLHWDDKVTDLLPGFRLYDPYVTRELTVRDLLSHRSGLGLGSGDLMLFPPSDFTRAEIIHNLRYLPPASSFRSKYAYDNLLYIVAGELIPKITGISWEQFVQTKILDRLGTGCAATLTLTGANHNVAAPHVVIDGKLAEVAPDPSTAYDPAGSIQCNANGMAAWANLQLAGGQLPDGSTLFSIARHKEMWTPQTIVPVSTSATNPQTRFRNYGLGWFIEDYDGALRVTHTGGLIGMVSYVSLLPEQHVGVVVLTNQQSGAAMSAMMQTLLDAFLHQPPSDWVAVLKARGAEQIKRAEAADRDAEAAIKTAGGQAFLPLDAYAGLYHDAWRGDVTVKKVGDKLRLVFSRTTDMQGDLQAMKGNVFAVRWDNRSLMADALVNFRTGLDGAVSGMTMAPLSPTTDFSFDFQDLDFKKVASGS